MARSSDGGFALVEALASLVVVALLSLMVVAGLGTGRRVWQGLDQREAGVEALAAAQSVVRERIADLYPGTVHDGADAFVDIDGQPHEVAFLSAPMQNGRPAPLRRYKLIVTDDGSLALASVSDAAAPADRAPAVAVLMRGVRRMDVAYFGADGADPQPVWRDQWRRRVRPPTAVRIRLALTGGRWWPDLIVRPRASVGTDCVYSANGPGGCPS